MATKNTRFDVIYNQGNGLTSPNIQILVDKETGIQYLFTQSGYAGGLTPLLNADGTPVVTPGYTK